MSLVGAKNQYTESLEREKHMIDKNISAVWVGVLVACLVIVLTKGHKEPVSTCYAYVKDGYGNTHVLQGVQSND